MKTKSDNQIIEFMRVCFLPSKQYHRCSSYALKHVLQQADKAFYMPEGRFIDLLQKAGYSIKATASMHYRVKVWVVPNPKVNKSLWGKGYEKKYIDG